MSRKVLVHNTVLDLLKESDNPLSTNEICSTLELSYDSVVRLMRELTRNKQVKRLPGSGHSYRYKYLTHERSVSPTDLPVGQSNIVGIIPKKIPSDSLFITVEKWAKDGWSPSLLKSTDGILLALSELYRWALLSASGQSITDNELKTPYDKLLYAKTEATKYLEFVTGLMTTPELWDGKTFAFFLLKDVTDIDAVKDLADSLRAQSKRLNT